MNKPWTMPEPGNSLTATQQNALTAEILTLIDQWGPTKREALACIEDAKAEVAAWPDGPPCGDCGKRKPVRLVRRSPAGRDEVACVECFNPANCDPTDFPGAGTAAEWDDLPEVTS